MKRLIRTVEIRGRLIQIKVPAYYIDRLQAEGIDTINVFVDDEKKEMTIEPADKIQK